MNAKYKKGMFDYYKKQIEGLEKFQKERGYAELSFNVKKAIDEQLDQLKENLRFYGGFEA